MTLAMDAAKTEHSFAREITEGAIEVLFRARLINVKTR
jgi:hypothetical protein